MTVRMIQVSSFSDNFINLSGVSLSTGTNRGNEKSLNIRLNKS